MGRLRPPGAARWRRTGTPRASAPGRGAIPGWRDSSFSLLLLAVFRVEDVNAVPLVGHDDAVIGLAQAEESAAQWGTLVCHGRQRVPHLQQSRPGQRGQEAVPFSEDHRRGQPGREDPGAARQEASRRTRPGTSLASPVRGHPFPPPRWVGRGRGSTRSAHDRGTAPMRQTLIPNSFSALRNAIFSLSSRGRSTARNQSVPSLMLSMKG